MKELVLIAGWGFSRRVWDPLIDQLEGDFKLVACDLSDLKASLQDPGGKERARRSRPTMASARWSATSGSALEFQDNSCYAHGLRNFLSQHDRPLVAGWSMGGMIALEAAVADPHLCRGLLLISSTLKFCSADGYACGVPPTALRAMKRGLNQNPQETLNAFLENTEKPQTGLLDVQQREAFMINDVDELMDGLTYLQDADLRTATLPASLPAAVMHGTRDAVIPMAAGKWMAKQLGDRPFLACPGMGHALPYAVPEKVAKDLKKVLNDLS